MSFCPICNADHDPNFACGDRTGSVMAAAGLQRLPKSKNKSKDNSSRIFLIIFLSMGLVMLIFGVLTLF